MAADVARWVAEVQDTPCWCIDALLRGWPLEAKNSKEVMLTAVRRSGFTLRFASALRGDREVVLAAVEQDCMAVKYAAEAMRADREIATLAVRGGRAAMKHVAGELQWDKELLEIAVEAHGPMTQACQGQISSTTLRSHFFKALQNRDRVKIEEILTAADGATFCKLYRTAAHDLADAVTSLDHARAKAHLEVIPYCSEIIPNFPDEYVLPDFLAMFDQNRCWSHQAPSEVPKPPSEDVDIASTFASDNPQDLVVAFLEGKCLRLRTGPSERILDIKIALVGGDVQTAREKAKWLVLVGSDGEEVVSASPLNDAALLGEATGSNGPWQLTGVFKDPHLEMLGILRDGKADLSSKYGVQFVCTGARAKAGSGAIVSFMLADLDPTSAFDAICRSEKVGIQEEALRTLLQAGADPAPNLRRLLAQCHATQFKENNFPLRCLQVLLAAMDPQQYSGEIQQVFEKLPLSSKKGLVKLCPWLVADPEFMRRVLAKDGLALELAPPELRESEDAVFLAAQQNLSALAFASDALRSSPTFAEHVLGLGTRALGHILPELLQDERVAKAFEERFVAELVPLTNVQAFADEIYESKAAAQVELDRIMPFLHNMELAIQRIRKPDIVEIKCNRNPVAIIKYIFDGLAIFMQKPLVPPEHTHTVVNKIMFSFIKDSYELTRRDLDDMHFLQNLEMAWHDRDKYVNEETLELLEPYVRALGPNRPPRVIDSETAAKASGAAAALATFICEFDQYARACLHGGFKSQMDSLKSRESAQMKRMAERRQLEKLAQTLAPQLPEDVSERLREALKR